jgi:sulfofructose kinase
LSSVANHRFDLNFSVDRPFDVVGFGQNAVDHVCLVPHYPAFNTKLQVTRYRQMAGGQIATAMAECALLGMRVKYIGKVGADDLGRFSLDSLKEFGIDTANVMVEPDSYNHYSFIMVDATNGERTILFDRDERLRYRAGEISPDSILSGKLLHLDANDLQAAIQCSKWAKSAGMPICLDIDRCDPGVEDLLPQIDFLIPSENFPLEFSGTDNLHDALHKLNRITGGFVCATLGARGALALFDGEYLPSPGFKVQTVDTTGAGDVFHGAFLYGVWKNWPLISILEFANAAAAINCAHLGARGGLTRIGDVLGFLRDRGVSLNLESGQTYHEAWSDRSNNT